MTMEQDIAGEVKLLGKKNSGKVNQVPTEPTMPRSPTPDEIEAGLLAWRRTQLENEQLKYHLAQVKAEKDEMRGVLKSLASILVTYQNSLTEQDPVQS
jgi:hypothetical protein